jgi:glutamine synthetase
MENALEFAKSTYVDVDIHRAENKALVEKLAQLPASCWESADELSAHRNIFEAHGVFDRSMIDDIIKQLKSFKDKNIRNEIVKNPDLMLKIVKEFFYCG